MLDLVRSDLAQAVRTAAEPLPPPEADSAFARAFDRFGDARVVLLGEATHGTSEFYKARAAITKRLIDRHGFRIVAVEADWPDAEMLDRFIRGRGEGASTRRLFARFPQWMWRNREVDGFIRDLREWNLGRPADDRAEFRGLDLYSLHESMDEVLRYLDQRDPDAAAEARRRYACLTPYQGRPELYGAIAARAGRDCKTEVVAQLTDMLRRRLEARDGEALLDAAQNARVVHAAESYYRAMYEGAVESWNLRDRHMFTTLKTLLDARGKGAKAVVWAHNSHIGDAAATAMGWAGEWNIGELCKEAFGRDAVLIGFGTDRGRVAAADDWGEPMRIKDVKPSRPDSWERVFLEAGVARSLTTWRDDGTLGEKLAEPRLERAIGVIYRPETERQSHYFEAELSRQFDAFVWFEETTPVTPIPGPTSDEEPETWPFAL